MEYNDALSPAFEMANLKINYSTRIKVCAFLFLVLFLVMALPSTVQISGETSDWIMAIFPIPEIILLSTVILRGKIIEKIVALIVLSPFVWIAVIGITSLFARY
jgi:hypothetical protein